MVIKTKFDVGDRVTGISSKHLLVAFEIAKIVVSAKADSVEVEYYPSDGNGGYEFTSFAEKYCFSTKGEALAYIQGE